MAYAYSQHLEGGLAIIAKRRKSASEVESMAVIGEVRGKNVLLVDDLTDADADQRRGTAKKGRNNPGLRFPRHLERCGHRKIAQIGH